MHYLAKERKRKKKKLKSRRERNKRKAILKLSHITKNHVSSESAHHVPALPPPPTSSSNPLHTSDDKKSTAEIVLSPPGTMGENPKNGGVPIFVQERLEGRSRRKLDVESTTEILLNEVHTMVTYSIVHKSKDCTFSLYWTVTFALSSLQRESAGHSLIVHSKLSLKVNSLCT